jgi:hypothetical protein
MWQKIPRAALAGLPASVRIARPAARREFAPGGSEWRLSPSGPPAQTVAIGFNKANANYVPYTNPEITS